MIARLIFLLVLLLSFSSFAQEKTRVEYSTIDTAILNPDETTALILNCDSSSLKKFFELDKPLRNLTSIILNGETDPETFRKIFSKLSEMPGLKELEINSENFSDAQIVSSLKTLEKISIRACPTLNYKSLFDNLAPLNELKQLILDNNKLTKLPGNIEKLAKVSTLRISSNSLLNFKKAVGAISKMPALTELSLYGNDLTEVPANIGKLEKIEVLDLRSNNITVLKEEMSDLKKSRTLRLEGNYIADPVFELGKAKNPNLKVLTLDKGLNEEDMNEIKKIFPAAQIREVDILTEAELSVDSTPSDTLKLSPEDAFKLKAVLSEKIDTGTFRVQRNEVKALSNAYLYYPKLYNTQKFSYEYDTLLFDVRYFDTTYCNTWKIQPNQKYPNIVLEVFKQSPKGELWFDFSREMDRSRFLVKNNPEINAFVGMKWVYIGDPMTRREFKRSYIKNKMYLDARIYYNEPEKNFTIELKEKSGFTKLNAYLRVPDLGSPIESSQKFYTKRYERYLKVLQRREDKFHKKLFRDKSRYDKMFYQREAKIWEVFRSQMSSRERQMNKEEWLAYYDEIMREEKKALYSSAANAGNLLRSLEIEGYKIVNAVEMAMANNVKEYSCTFNDENAKKIADSKVFIIAPGKKEVYVFEGNLGAKETALFIEFSSNYKIVIESRSGHLALATEDELQKIDYQKSSLLIPAKVMDKNLTSIGQVRRALKLE